MERKFWFWLTFGMLCLTSLVFGGGTSESASKKDAGKVKFSLWHSYVGTDQRAPFMEERMAQFRAQNPNYEIEEQKIARDQYQTKLKTAAAAGQLPDGFQCWPNAMVREFATAGLLSEINDLLESNPEWAKSFVKRAFDEFTVGGKVYSAGLGISVCSIIYYNNALFQKYNLSFPKTYDELKHVISVFKQNNIIPIAMGNKPKWPMQSTLFSIVANRSTGTEWLENVLAKKGAKFTDPEFVRALQIIIELTKMGAFNSDVITIDNVQMRDYFYRGEAAMAIEGSWMLPDIIKRAPDSLKQNLEMEIFPPIPGGKGDPNVMSGVSGTGIVINRKATSEQKEAIKKLILHVSNTDAQLLFAKYGIPVSSKNVSIDPKTVDPVYLKIVALIAKHPLVTVYDSALNSEQTEIINNGLQAIMVGAKTPEQVAIELQGAVK